MPPLAPSPPRARFPSVLLLLISLVASLAPRVRAAPEPAALATTHRAGRDPAPLPPHLRQSDPAQHRPLPEAIRSVRFNAPPPAHSPAVEPLETDDEQQESAGFQLSPLVLTVTVDGQVHALKRDTGQWVWTLHDDGGIATGGLGRGTKEDRLRRSSAGEAIGGPLVQSQSRRRRTAGGTAPRAGALSNETGVVAGEPSEVGENDETYIIEPTGEGDIYVYSRSTGGLDKLPLSMQELVTLSPFRFPGDASRMFSASKNTKFVGVDLKTGRLVGVFGSSAGWCEWDDADELTAGGRTVDYEEDIDQRPEDLLYMART
ncbi:hypothetical protein JCM3770_003663, partial [Rhodotorula araucariae]